MKVRRVDFSPDEWIAGTIDLSLAERGMYITACSLIYSRGGPILTGILRSFCREDLRTYNRCLDHLLELHKLDLKDGYLSNKRCVSELESAEKRVASAVENGRKGGRPSKENSSLAKPDGSDNRKANHQPSTINHQEDKKESSLAGAKEGSLVGAARTKRRVPDGWQPNAAGVAYALDRAGWVGPRLVEETEHFCNRSQRDGKCFVNIDAGWRTWVQQGAKFDRERDLRNGKQTPVENLYEGAFRAAERWEREHGKADIEPDRSVIVPLLDSRRSSGNA